MNTHNINDCNSIIFFFLLSLPLLSQADLGQLNLKMTATLVADSCTVSNESAKTTVNLGSWSTKQFTSVSRESTPVPFTITLEDCDIRSRELKVFFKGNADSNDKTLLAISGSGLAKNIAVAILDSNRKRISLGQPSIIQKSGANQHINVLNFYGQYVATAGAVSPGTADANATFTLEYY
ncbi:fimbrial protein [Salmonella enterica subsp. enterica serovar Berlin]|nr:fimbrial protein [Salmonella enterica]EBY0806365.1 fimbrial protein [Salmonella enterica subsp. enterica serovar Berlin]